MPGADEVIRNLDAWYNSKLAALYALAEHFGLKMEAYAKPNARWTDRTGHARQGIFGSASHGANTIYVHLSGSAQHSVFLELANSGKYAILDPTVKEFAPEFFREAERVLRS